MQSSPPGAILREPRIQELYEAVSTLKPKLGRTLSSVVGTYGILLFSYRLQ
jgi:hepatocyte growth factor-regulated tyrosine kinase substrate